jgi:hypothetical protein
MPMETGRQHPPAERNRERATYKMIHFWQEEYTDFHIMQAKLNPFKMSDLKGCQKRMPMTKPPKIVLFKV